MDKRQIKTQNAIYEAFAKVLENKPYSKLTIEDILKESGTSRSTFYAHYKTKDELLNSILNGIFDHVFSHTLTEEATHDFSKESILDYHHLITHIFYHLHDDKRLIQAILKSEGKSIFIENMKNHLAPLSNIIVKDNLVKNKELPTELHKAMVTDTFVLAIDYWFTNDCKESPEVITDYILEMNA